MSRDVGNSSFVFGNAFTYKMVSNQNRFLLQHLKRFQRVYENGLVIAINIGWGITWYSYHPDIVTKSLIG